MTARPEIESRSAKERAAFDWAWSNPDAVTLQALADAGGVKSTGTAQKWLDRWRAQLGDDLFRTEAAEARSAQTAAAREAAHARVVERRTQVAGNLLVTADAVRARVLEVLPDTSTQWVDRGPDGTAQPVVVYGPKASEIKALADTVAKLVDSVQLLTDLPTRHTRRSVEPEQWQPPGLPAGEAKGDDEKRSQIIDLRARILERRQVVDG